MLHLAVLLHLMVLALLGVLGLALAYATWRVVKRYAQCLGPQRTDNGVRVGAPKVYDNRSLTLMLEQLQSQLRALEQIDGTPLNSALGTAQGARSTQVSASGALDVAPVRPAQAGTSVPGGAGVGTPAPALDGKSATDTLPATDPSLKWSERAADLLDDQINLSYQIFNLRLLLERAISDRLTEDFSPRLQAVVALPVSIDTPAFAIGCAAIIEVRFSIDIPEGSPQTDLAAWRTSLVALFPQEETYNTLSVDRRSAHGSAGVASGPFGGAASVSGNRSSAFIRRQADIVAVEREPTAGDRLPNRGEPLIVAWEFRPSAGEPSVKSGLRQVLAVLALPQIHAQQAGEVKVNVDVRSSWRRWNATTGTSADRAGWRPLFTDRPVSHAFGGHGRVSVPLVARLDSCLAPQITSITWYRIGQARACITVKGLNFFTGTTVIMGGEIVSADTSLTIKSEETLQVIVPVAALLEDALLNGRYGASLAMEQVPRELPSLYIGGLWINPKPGNQSYEAVLSFSSNSGAGLKWEDFLQLPTPVVALNGKVIESGLQFEPQFDQTVGSGTFSTLTARAMVNPDSLGTSLMVTVRWPFCGAAWSLHYQTYNSAAPINILRSEAGTEVVLLLCGPEFETGLKVILGDIYAITEQGPLTWVTSDISDVLSLRLPRSVVDAHGQLVVLRAGRATIQVPIPRAGAPAPEPSPRVN
jgi:hypothetical protein